MLKSIRIASFLCLSWAAAASAQTVPATFEAPPSISGSAMSEVKVAPDRATIRISVETHAPTATAAASANATEQNRVLTALRALGLTNEQLSTVGYNVNPEYRYEQNKSPVVTGYVVTNTVIADIRDLKQVGKVLDAAIAAGANNISSLEFYASNTDAARHQAIGTAIAKARAEADAAARAAGGTIGGLLTLSIDNASSPPPPRPMMYAAAKSVANDTAINPGDQTVSITISASWRFVPAAR